ncbi:hypothetical protein [Saccharopolyspora shandongensis]|uniref:hypothetical protein n=1 Tax=Saccharopolyspora shandongensis TaxID=418495 RepID=UPI00115F827A|nr:hypothetical protein [Saccharopolyspora shandongensis]
MAHAEAPTLELTRKRKKLMSPRILVAATAFLCIGSITSCAASYDERMEYLRETSLRGIETNSLLRGQGKEITVESCKNANLALNNDAPSDRGGPDAHKTEAWAQLIEETFVSACVSGKF